MRGYGTAAAAPRNRGTPPVKGRMRARNEEASWESLTAAREETTSVPAFRLRA